MMRLTKTLGLDGMQGPDGWLLSIVMAEHSKGTAISFPGSAWERKGTRLCLVLWGIATWE